MPHRRKANGMVAIYPRIAEVAVMARDHGIEETARAYQIMPTTVYAYQYEARHAAWVMGVDIDFLANQLRPVLYRYIARSERPIYDRERPEGDNWRPRKREQAEPTEPIAPEIENTVSLEERAPEEPAMSPMPLQPRDTTASTPYVSRIAYDAMTNRLRTANERIITQERQISEQTRQIAALQTALQRREARYDRMLRSLETIGVTFELTPVLPKETDSATDTETDTESRESGA